MDKKNIALFLAVVAITALIVSLSIEDKEGILVAREKNLVTLSGEEINRAVLKAVSGFGIKEEWIKEVKKGKQHDSLFASYNITVPADLPITILIREVGNSFPPSSAELKSTEEKINGRSRLEIYSKGIKKLSVIFDYNKAVVRSAGQVGVVIDNITLLKEEEMQELFYTPEIFAVLVTPSAASKKLVEGISFNKKEYGILLDDKITDLEFKLSNNYSEARLKSSIRSIFGSFGKAIFFVADEESNLYNSSIFPFIRKEIEKRKIPIILKSAIVAIEGSNKEDFLLNFKSTVVSASETKGKMILVTAENYKDLWEEMLNFRKVGYKFINPSQLKPLYL